MAISRRNLSFLENFLEEIGERYINLVGDQVGLAIPSAYCSYLLSTGHTECIILIDGSNSFNPYHVTHYSRLFSVDEEKVMKRILLSRAFTCHQMSALLGNCLQSAVKRFGAKTIIVSDPTYIYVERSAEEDVMEEFISAYRRLLGITYSLRLTTLIIHSGRVPRILDGCVLEDGRRQRAARFSEKVLFTLSDSVYRLDEEPRGFSVTRIKHPFFSPRPAYFIPTGPRIRTLDEVLQGSASRFPDLAPVTRLRGSEPS